jgi:hypothetical protein
LRCKEGDGAQLASRAFASECGNFRLQPFASLQVFLLRDVSPPIQLLRPVQCLLQAGLRALRICRGAGSLHLGERRNPGGVHASYRSIRAFLRWTWEENETDTCNPISRVRPPKVGQELLEPVSLTSLRALLSTCDGQSFTGCTSTLDVDLKHRCILHGWYTRLIVRAQDAGNYVAFDMDCCTAEVVLVVGGSEQTLVSLHEDGLLYHCPEGWPIDQLQLEVRGNIYTAIHNGVTMHTVQDNTFSRGRAGIGAREEYGTHITFDRFGVTAQLAGCKFCL